ncbi:hypothetical protein [Hoeflea ulvae]|uniref:Uncharacterized protein n=1 Tax=Hoeflea ulvae TaxID=2983764 RepID=A0ABT3YFC2_9HYPH|nr:hypothetical protein [Hoeflea ulvae]MCY0094601.1 hypothetical protein [Hoeflea ulvae]
MSVQINWLADIAGDARISSATVRLAAAAAGMAGPRGRYRGRMIALASAAQLSSRHAPDMLQDLAKRGFLRIHHCEGGRLDLEMIMPRDEAAPTSEKSFRQISGSIVGIDAKSKASIVAYIESEVDMVKLTIGRGDAEAIAAAIVLENRR